MGIQGNETADQAASEALKPSVTVLPGLPPCRGEDETQLEIVLVHSHRSTPWGGWLKKGV